MKESSQSQVQTETPSHSEAAVLFPPHRRRPLLSRTYRTLIGILSHCHTTSSQLQTHVDSGDTELRTACEERASITDVKVTSTDIVGPFASSKNSSNELVQETSVGEKEEILGLHERYSSDTHAAGPKADDTNLKPDAKQEITSFSTSSIADVLTDENQKNECAIQLAKEQPIANSIVGIQRDDSSVLEQLDVDKEFSVSDFSEILDSCYGMDMVVDPIEGSQENGTVLVEGPYQNSENELRLKEMELEKLIYNSGVVELTACPNPNDEMEEGEISGDFGDIDALSEDVISLQENTVEMAHDSQAATDKEEFTCDGEDSRHTQYEMADASFTEIANSNNNFNKVESRTTVAHVQDCHLKIVVCDGNAEAQNSVCLENGTSIDKITQQNASENQNSDSTKKDGDMEKKKRKKGPLTKERRAKKKKKERIKRAEKNRQLGIKRLKLPPVVKQKKIVYCRHYLQGRCLEGEKCNFSHDTVPLTKSKPCNHFARHSCMKGDDCPFDHELSKYPCNNYATNGFCSRGSDCLFSHKLPAIQSLPVAPGISKPESTSVQHTMPIKEGSFSASKVTKLEVKLPTSLNNPDSSKKINKHGLFSQKIDSKFCSAVESPQQNTEPAASRTAGKAPKGVSFLLNGEMPLGDSSGNRQGGSSFKTSDGVEFGCKTTKVPGSANKSKETSERAAPKKPRGINFLSFAQPPLTDDSTSKMILNLLSKHAIETGKSVVEDVGGGKLTSSALETVETLKGNRQMSQSAICVNGTTHGTSMTVPENMNFSPFDDILSHVSKKQDNILPSESNAALSFIKERLGISSQFPDSKIPPLRGPEDQSTGQETSDLSSSFKPPYLPNAPSSVQKAVQSTLAFASKLEPSIKVGASLHQWGR